MGITKTDLHSEQQNKIAQHFKVLGHPARIAILQYIIDRKSCICNDLVTELGLAQATISQHLKELKTIGILKGSIEGKSMCYCIDEEVWKKLQDNANHFLNQDVRINRCC